LLFESLANIAVVDPVPRGALAAAAAGSDLRLILGKVWAQTVLELRRAIALKLLFFTYWPWQAAQVLRALTPLQIFCRHSAVVQTRTSTLVHLCVEIYKADSYHGNTKARLEPSRKAASSQVDVAKCEHKTEARWIATCSTRL
jgi:hypothetical protein